MIGFLQECFQPVDRRIGGLEICVHQSKFTKSVDRCIGGLENNNRTSEK